MLICGSLRKNDFRHGLAQSGASKVFRLYAVYLFIFKLLCMDILLFREYDNRLFPDIIA